MGLCDGLVYVDMGVCIGLQMGGGGVGLGGRLVRVQKGVLSRR